MVKIKVSEASNVALNWLVGKAEGFFNGNPPITFTDNDDDLYEPTENWKQGGPIIEREGIRWNEHSRDGIYAWVGGHEYYDPLHIPMGELMEHIPNPAAFAWGESLLIAAMRCYVASKLGELVEVPEIFIKEYVK